MIELLQQPLPWYIAGPLIGLMVPALLIMGNRSFGLSSSLRHICAVCIPAKIPFFRYDWKKESWNLFFAGGIAIGGLIAGVLLPDTQSVQVSPKLVSELSRYGITDYHSLVPRQLFNWQVLFSVRGFILMIVGGFLVGFGTRYAGGCTSGHSIMGLSNLQVPSLIATVCFMTGGFIMANLYPSLYFNIVIMNEVTGFQKDEINTDFEVRSLDAAFDPQHREEAWWSYIKYLIAGILFGIILVKSEVISWFRIQEMFRLQSFHMFGVIGSAIVTGIISLQIIKRFHIKTIHGETIELAQKKFHKGQIYGGFLFGFGWALTGACPGPLFAQIGTGAIVIIVTLFSAIAGTWVYGLVRDKLPH